MLRGFSQEKIKVIGFRVLEIILSGSSQEQIIGLQMKRGDIMDSVYFGTEMAAQMAIFAVFFMKNLQLAGFKISVSESQAANFTTRRASLFWTREPEDKPSFSQKIKEAGQKGEGVVQKVL